MEIDFFDILKNSLMITSLVIIMMSLIEYVNVISKGRFVKGLSKNIYVQAFIGVFLGVIPGCMGSFLAVSLYTHKALSFGALVACMIATSGDESFFMLATMPKKALLLFLILGVIAFFVSIIVDKLFKNKDFTSKNDIPFDVHEDFVTKERFYLSLKNFKWSTNRGLLSLLFVSIITLCFFGVIGHTHSENMIFSLPQSSNALVMETAVEHETAECHEHHSDNCSDNCEHHHEEDCGAVEHHHHHEGPDFVKIIIISLAFIMLVIVMFSNEHFLSEHLMHHVVKHHLLKVFLWTFGILILVSVMLKYTDFGNWIYDNMYIFLLISVLVGTLPESGPHLIFVVLYVGGYIPFSILLANSIVQDGHGALPLLAESKKGFFVMKGINILVGLMLGLAGLMLGF